MNLPSSDTHQSFGDDERTRILRSFLIALVGTSWLLIIDPVRQIVSLEATLAGFALGVVLGTVATVALVDVDFRDVNNVTASIVALVSICVATIATWLIVPDQYLGTFLQFTIAFVWTMPVAQLLHHRYRAPESN